MHVALAVELPALVHDHEVVGCEAPADVVDADRHEALGLCQQRERLAAAADDDGLATMAIAVVTKALVERSRLARSPSSGVGDVLWRQAG